MRSDRFVIAVVAAVLISGALLAVGVMALLTLTYFALPLGEDTWRHYAGGGVFATAAPNLSADGSRVVFATPATGHGDIYLCDLSSNEVNRVTSSTDCELSPWFRPHDQQVLFARERDGCRHIWLLDLKSGRESQITEGPVLDDIYDVSPSGHYILIGRSPRSRGMGRSVTTYVVDLKTGNASRLADSFFGLFQGRDDRMLGTLYDEGGKPSIVTLALDGKLVKTHAKGHSLHAMNTRGDGIVVGGELPDGINTDLSFWNLDTGTREAIGKGHSPCIFDNGKVLFFTGYERDAWIWGSGQRPRKIDSPNAVLDVPRRIVGDQAAVFSLLSNDQEAHLFDADTERFTRIGQAVPE